MQRSSFGNYVINCWTKPNECPEQDSALPDVTLPRESELNQLQSVCERTCSPGETAVAETFYNETE